MKKNFGKIAAVGMAVTMLLGTTAFARENILISAAPETSISDSVLEEQASMFISQSGKIVSIEKSATDGVIIVTIENDMGGLRFAVASDTILVDRKTGSFESADKFEKGMEVTVVYGVNSPMGMSFPAFLSDAAAVVLNSDAGSIAVGRFDNDLTDWVNMLKLNIGDETSIQNMKGARIRLSAEDIKGKDALVFYDFTTRSIPAQTTPSFVLILEDSNAQLVPLRETAEAEGYKVQWQGKEKPILLTKAGVSIKLMLDDDSYVVNGETKQLSLITTLESNGLTYVSNEIFE